MPEFDQTPEEPQNEPDLVEDREDDDGFVVALSRGVGVVARTVSDGLHGVADAFRSRKQPPRRIPAEPITELIEKLGQVMMAHQATGFAELEQEPEFWKLISKVRLARRRQIAARGRGRGGRRRRDIEDAVLDDSESAPASRSAVGGEPDSTVADQEFRGGRRSFRRRRRQEEVEPQGPAPDGAPPADPEPNQD
jgi:hypothetical protein